MSFNTVNATHYYADRIQTVTTTATAATIGLDIGPHIDEVVMSCTQDCHYKLGSEAELTASPATTSDLPLFAGTYKPIRVKPGQRLSFIRASVDGRAWVEECTQ